MRSLSMRTQLNVYANWIAFVSTLAAINFQCFGALIIIYGSHFSWNKLRRSEISREREREKKRGMGGGRRVWSRKEWDNDVVLVVQPPTSWSFSVPIRFQWARRVRTALCETKPNLRNELEISQIEFHSIADTMANSLRSHGITMNQICTDLDFNNLLVECDW